MYEQARSRVFEVIVTYVIPCAIWYNLYNLEKVKNSHGGMLHLVNFTLLKGTLIHGCFSCFLNCAYGTKSRKASHMHQGYPTVRS